VGNPITDRLKIGTLGELLVQLRLLEHNVQAAPPIKDSGNDLIAVRGEAFRGIQIKTTAVGRIDARRLPNHYHIVALVYLASSDVQVLLDESEVFLVPRSAWEASGHKEPDNLSDYRISSAHVDALFREDVAANQI
jgi:hypothetical protein